MKPVLYVFAYVAMLCFDSALIVGTFWAIQFYDWSAWWVLLTVLILDGSSPRKLLGMLT
jgi:hypothetical protein